MACGEVRTADNLGLRRDVLSGYVSLVIRACDADESVILRQGPLSVKETISVRESRYIELAPLTVNRIKSSHHLLPRSRFIPSSGSERYAQSFQQLPHRSRIALDQQ